MNKIDIYPRLKIRVLVCFCVTCFPINQISNISVERETARFHPKLVSAFDSLLGTWREIGTKGTLEISELYAGGLEVVLLLLLSSLQTLRAMQQILR